MIRQTSVVNFRRFTESRADVEKNFCLFSTRNERYMACELYAAD